MDWGEPKRLNTTKLSLSSGLKGDIGIAEKAIIETGKSEGDFIEVLKGIENGNEIILECLPPSKYFAGSCYTYMKMLPATSWNRAYNNCLTLPMTNDARLLVIGSIAEYEFVERELIGPKSGSDSVSVYVGLRKINSKFLCFTK